MAGTNDDATADAVRGGDERKEPVAVAAGVEPAPEPAPAPEPPAEEA